MLKNSIVTFDFVSMPTGMNEDRNNDITFILETANRLEAKVISYTAEGPAGGNPVVVLQMPGSYTGGRIAALDALELSYTVGETTYFGQEDEQC